MFTIDSAALYLTINSLFITAIFFSLQLFGSHEMTNSNKKRYKKMFRFFLYLTNISNLLIMLCILLSSTNLVENYGSIIFNIINVIEIIIIIFIFFTINAILNIIFNLKK